MSTFEEAVQHERTRLMGLISEAKDKIGELESQVAADERRIETLDAYERIKAGKPPSKAPKKMASSPRSSTVLAMLKGSRGMTLDQILREADVDSGTPESASISLSLEELKKKGKLELEGGMYTAL